MRGMRIAIAVLPAAWWICVALLCPWMAAGGARQDGLLFRASLDSALAADFAAGDSRPLVSQDVHLADSAAAIPRTAVLAYDAHANLYAEQGSLSFWWRPGEPPDPVGFPVFMSFYEQDSTWSCDFLRVNWDGRRLVARLRDRNLAFHNAEGPVALPRTGRWMHIAVTWAESAGLVLYLDGAPAGRAPGPLALDARLTFFGFLLRGTPPQWAGALSPGSIDEVRIYRAPLEPGDIQRLAHRHDPRQSPALPPPRWAQRFGWHEASGVPAGSKLKVRRLAIRDARVFGKLWMKGADGKRETLWPMADKFPAGADGLYLDEGKQYRVFPAREPMNLVRTTGNLEGRIRVAPHGSYARPAGELHYRRFASGGVAKEISIDRHSGMLGDLECLRIEETAEPAASGAWTRFATAGQDARLAARRDPGRFRTWRPAPRPAAKSGHEDTGRYDYFLVAVPQASAFKGVRLRLRSIPNEFYYVAVEDPVNTVRQLIEIDVRAREHVLELTLEFPPIVAPAGSEVVITLASSSGRTPELEAQLLPDTFASARPAYLAQRILQIRDSLQMMSEGSPWGIVNAERPLPLVRRQLRQVDELFVLLDDVRRIDPGNPVARAYRTWFLFREPTPALAETARDPAVPLWVHRQIQTMDLFRRIPEWWIDHRQIANGELGGGLGDDTDMIQDWPAIALMDGPVAKTGKALRRVLDACYNAGMLKQGLNARRLDALHAYEEGINAQAPAFLLDYGNPVLFERMMETAAHYERLTGINAAGHRHMRSHVYSATELVEDGYHAREFTQYSHHILHPGLYVAWYNGSPALTSLLCQLGDSLLAHWSQEQYPKLSSVVFFADDRAAEPAPPGSMIWNFFWGLYDLTGDEKYLWLLRQGVKASDYGTLSMINGPWLSLLGRAAHAPGLRAAAAQLAVRDRNVVFHHPGPAMVALAWRATGDRTLLEEADEALVRTMTPLTYVLTEGHLYTDRVPIPTLGMQIQRMGGVAHYRNFPYPGHAVSWENTGNELGALVSDSRPGFLRCILFNAGLRSRTITGRVWQLEHGRYEATMRDPAGRLLWNRTLRLKRHSAVELPLPPRTEVAVELRQIEKLAPLHSLPDLAVASEEIRITGGLEIPVHNIGGAPSQPYTVSVADDGGKVLAEQSYPGLEAPSDLKPRVRIARFAGVPERHGLRVRVRQQGLAEEVCDTNNEAALAGETVPVKKAGGTGAKP